MSRPEHIAPADIFYNEEEAKKYASNSRMMEIQTRMSERAIELMRLPDYPCHILDIGCGSGLSGEVLSEMGHTWVGVDVSASMLGVARAREVEGDLIYCDIGDGLMFRPGSFDGCMSISVLQWLCNADHKSHVPHKRLKRFFQSLYNCLCSGSRAVFQFYPETPQQMQMITTAAMSSGFSGGVVIDYPNSRKAKKYFLCLFAGEPGNYQVPAGLDGSATAAPSRRGSDNEDDDEDEDDEGDDIDDGDMDMGAVAGGRSRRGSLAGPFSARGGGDDDDDLKDLPEEERRTVQNVRKAAAARIAERRRRSSSKKGGRAPLKSKEWVMKKKDRMRAQGKKVARDSKFSARRRPGGF